MKISLTRKLRNLSLQTRSMITLGFLVGLLVLTGGIATWGILRLNSSAQRAFHRADHCIRAHAVLVEFLDTYRHQMRVLTEPKAETNDLGVCSRRLEKAIREFGSAAASVEEKVWAVEMEKGRDRLVEVYQGAVLPAVNAMLEARNAAEKGQFELEAKAAGREGDEVLKRLIGPSRKRLQSALLETEKATAEFISRSATLSSAIAGISLSAALIGALFAFKITQHTTRLVRHLTGQLWMSAEETGSAAAEVSSSNQSLANGIGEQAASLEETSSALEEMSSLTKSNADCAQSANALAKQARAAADRGAMDLQAMAAAMQAIKTSSNDIAKIIKTIDEIAFQTNILALNAAVEAARAGDAGLGFAVVADEVRSLAQQSAQAARETAAKIEGAIARTEQGVEVSTTVAQGLQEIVTKIRRVDELVEQVAVASKQQSQGIEQINATVSQMDKVTQGNAANAEESASAAAELDAKTESLEQSVTELVALVHGNSFQEPKEDWRKAPANASSRSLESGEVAGAHNDQSNAVRTSTPSPQPRPTPQQQAIPMDDDFKDF
ncbi:MAG: hypothetical protein HY735_25170 [Verrucomicrobia bacterium]|nr:hypothetical protein [Verrucomicrobiota bacterium]